MYLLKSLTVMPSTASNDPRRPHERRQTSDSQARMHRSLSSKTSAGGAGLSSEQHLGSSAGPSSVNTAGDANTDVGQFQTAALSTGPVAQQVPATRAVAGEERKKRSPFVFASLQLTPSQALAASTSAVRRILSSRLSEANAAREQAAIVTRVVSTLNPPNPSMSCAEDPFIVAFLDHVCANVAGRLDLLLVWLHREHSVWLESMKKVDIMEGGAEKESARSVADIANAGNGQDGESAMEVERNYAATSKRKRVKEEAAELHKVRRTETQIESDHSKDENHLGDDREEEKLREGRGVDVGKHNATTRFENCVSYTLERLDGAETPANLLGRVLIEMPFINEAWLDFVRHCCTSGKRTAMALASLRDVLQLRPTCREKSLPLLLELAHSFDPTLRRNAVFVCVKLFSVRI